MLCLNRQTGALCDRLFREFAAMVGRDDLLVFNNTKVIRARLFGRKQTGGKVEILIERILGEYRALAHLRASKSPAAGTRIELDNKAACTVTGREGDLFKLAFDNGCTVAEILEQIGHMPLPPYIARADESADMTRYQTVYARQAGAVAAPTAGLHFDQAMLDRLARQGTKKAFVTLHVGSGTFQPVRVENLDEHIMHREYYEVSDQTADLVRQTRQRGGRIIAIGTTSVRALESAAQSGVLKAGRGDTGLFITPGYQFKCVDALLTNFHLPESTLLMLISAFAGYHAVMQAYQHAISEQYRFFSYGDATFIHNN